MKQQFGKYIEEQTYRIMKELGYDCVLTQGKMDRQQGTDIILFTGTGADHIRIDITVNDKRSHLLPDGTPQVPHWAGVWHERKPYIGYGLKLGNTCRVYQYPVLCIQLPMYMGDAFYHSKENGLARLERCIKEEFGHAINWYLRTHLPIQA